MFLHDLRAAPLALSRRRTIVRTCTTRLIYLRMSRAVTSSSAPSEADRGAHCEDRAVQDEVEKMRRVLHELMHGRRSEKRVPSSPDQQWLPFENDAEFLAARAEAEAEAEVVIQTFTVQRKVRKRKPRNESFPDHLRREEKVAGHPSR